MLFINRPVTEVGAITSPGQRRPGLRNATCLQVMGKDDVGAVEVMVDPADPAVFSFKPLYTKP
ncbi:hypothetical protein [Deinococcus hopiensis]|uniref:Uncharacterized protein n=1 Tax=Deinococcus hopiensis KR-140 TaxID=695939 RepID=A0A1W1V7W9_9DEIO|nr:hypothetical protein [Deinococcus hopiensis]SMB89567.1 hypothetical protein SAMN00790413_00474 [Deinococcus hopiensis KR-140]